jgi:hypothetical protein
MSERRDAPARHASGHVRRLPDLGFAGPMSAKSAKVMVGFGLLLGTGTTTAATAEGSLPADRSTDLAASTRTAAMFADGRGDRAASRSLARAALPAVQAPQARSGPMRQPFGALGFTAEAKDTKKPAAAPDSPAGVVTADAGLVTADARLLAEARALGLGPNAQRVYVAIRTAFPEIGTIGGYRAGDPGDHGTGHAVDIMCTSSQGDRIVIFLQAHAAELNIKYLIWEQRIWFPGTTTWRLMEDRGSITANHYDHVHVSVY